MDRSRDSNRRLRSHFVVAEVNHVCQVHAALNMYNYNLCFYTINKRLVMLLITEDMRVATYAIYTRLSIRIHIYVVSASSIITLHAHT